MSIKPWREVVHPQADVSSGRYRQAEFAADLAQVLRGTAEAEYQDAAEFFARTFVTHGIRALILEVLRRLAGQTGEPVVQLKTAFGAARRMRCSRSITCSSGRSGNAGFQPASGSY